jgi:phenylacetyl-CoA:acceptor oxidoreductase subunit 2
MNRFYTVLQTSWDWRAAVNFMFGGTGSALILIIAIASLPGTPALPAGITALVLVGLGLFTVWLEIGRPMRFLHVFFHPQTSWMTREASVALLLFPVTLIGLLYRNPAIVIAAGLLGLVFLYCQARILLASKGIPSWREPAIVALIISTGLVEGSAVFILYLLLSGSSMQTAMLVLLPVLLVIRALSWNSYRQRLIAGQAPQQTLSILRDIHATTLWAGNITPAVLAAIALLIPVAGPPAGAVAALLALFSGWHMKFTIITRASQQQGYSVGKLKRGRPQIKPPVRRKPDRFVF